MIVGTEMRGAELRQVPERRDVDLHHEAEPVDLLVLERHLLADAGVVDEHVDATELLDGRVDDAHPVLLERQVGGDDERPLQLGGERLQPVLAASDEDHRRADGVEDPGEALAESGRRSGDDGDTSVETEHRERIEGGGGGIGRRHAGTLGSRSRSVETGGGRRVAQRGPASQRVDDESHRHGSRGVSSRR